MKLKAAYVTLAVQLQEAVGDITTKDARARLVAALMDEKAVPLAVGEAGARNSKSDLQLLQTIHDHAVGLGAVCADDETGELAEAKQVTGAGLKLAESTSWSEELVLIESTGREVEIKLIAPGKGSSAFYPAEVLKRDGPAVFTKNTQIYINHATRAEESERPEGDWHKLAGALSTDAYWKESAKHGDGLYAMAKFASDVAPAVLEKAPYSGMSIRANGDAVMEGKRPVMRDGVPVLAKLTSAESVDVVTRAGAGGMILTEAARSAKSNEGGTSDMDEATVNRLIESAVKSAQAPLLERAIRGDAREEGARLLESVTLPATSKHRVIETVLRDLPIKDGALDTVKFAEAVAAEAKREGVYVAALTGAGQVRGLGGSTPIDADPVKAREAREREKEGAEQDLKESVSVYTRLMGNPEAAKRAAQKGVAA